MADVTRLRPNEQVGGSKRRAIDQQIVQLYNAGTSIREIAELYGRSYGWVHGVLKAQKVELRRRGGAHGGAH